MHTARVWNERESITMGCRTNTLLALGCLLVFAPVARAQEAQDPMPNPQAMQMQVQRIMQGRPREAEAAARGWLNNVGPDLIPVLDSLKTASPDQYWGEVAQLTVQFDVFQNISRRDSVRAQLGGKMFGLEPHPRAHHPNYRTPPAGPPPPLQTHIIPLYP